ncbi:hypothetical protein I317_00136 [Kwoniella heveanensis CBS 569]|nr:hypothetical protein I317_00136 [Kwoniella heveanensis CBS 569]
MSDTSDQAEKDVHPDTNTNTDTAAPTAGIGHQAIDPSSESLAVDGSSSEPNASAVAEGNLVDDALEPAGGTEHGLEPKKAGSAAETSASTSISANGNEEAQTEGLENGRTDGATALEGPSHDENLSGLAALLEDEEGFDPATLANLAALSRIINEDDDEEAGLDGQHTPTRLDEVTEDALEVSSPRHDGPLTREQVQEFVTSLSHARDRDRDRQKDVDHDQAQDGGDEKGDDEKEEAGLRSDTEGNERDGRSRFAAGPKRRGEDGGDEDGEEPLRRLDDGDYEEEGKVTPGGRQKRKRNRNVLIKRGVPGMCRMEHPVLPQRKKRRIPEDEDINYELGVRVQALESLLRSGSLMDADQASAAARETIMHATKAANAGSQDANNALVQLTQSVAAGGGIGGMSQDAQSSLLLDVLQQLTAASMGRPLNSGGPAEGSHRKGLELWSAIPTASQETSVAITSAYEADEVPTKINLSLPGFREDNGKLFVPPTVRYVEKNMRDDKLLSRETLPIAGHVQFLDAGVRFAYGVESQAYRHKRIAAIQAVSLTGALRLAATFLSRFPAIPSSKTVFIPSPTADEDTTALQDAGLEIRSFRYLDTKTGGVDWENLREDLQDAPPKSIVLLQVSGSMPSGAELTTNQWRLLATLLQERELIPLVMMAYQGLATGDTNRDAQALRFMVHEGLPVVLVQSFDAMMGLYADSPSIVSIVTQNAEDRDRVDSQLRAIARGMWFHPSPWGAQVAHQILSDTKLFPAWLAEIKAMSDRLRSVREKMFDLLANKLKTPGTWTHLKKASGMYCTALLPASQVEALTAKRHVHLLPEGCFNLGCLNAPKIDILARAIDSVVREGIKDAEEQQAQRLAMELALAAAKEQQAREEAEAQAAAEAAEAAAAMAEDTLLMERSIANAMEAQKRAEEEERMHEDQRKEIDEATRKAMERAEIARQAELILATIS